jgi:ribosomal protein S12 methylthiotransferase accessory factor
VVCILKKAFFCLDNGEYLNIYNVSYYCVNTDDVVFLPERLLVASTGSSGMCAGNTAAEAITQGICEIFERFVLKQIYYGEPNLPDIPKALFKKYNACTVFINGFEERGFEVIIKDCSFGGRYPVVGVFLRKGNFCVFKLGASPHFSVATERCFTEIFQGRRVNGIENVFVPIEGNYNSKSNDVFKRDKYWDEQFYKTLTFDSGSLKSFILEKNTCFDEKNLFTFDNMSDTSTLVRLINRSVKDETLYIRDTSFLGFPTFYVYMPAFSTLYYSDFDNLKLTEKERLVKIFFNLENINEQDRMYLNKSLQNKKKQYPIKEILVQINNFSEISDRANQLHGKLQDRINQYDFSQKALRTIFNSRKT